VTTFDLSYEEAGDITLRTAGWAAFAMWWDTVPQSAGDACHNLVSDCAVKPDAGGLVALYEEGFGFLSTVLGAEILARSGVPGGVINARFPMVTLKEARAAHSRVAALNTAIGALPDFGSEVELAPMVEERAFLMATLIPLDALDVAERQGGRRVRFYRTGAGLLALRPPGAAAGSAFTDALAAIGAKQQGSSYAEANKALVLACAVSPDAPTLLGMIESNPGLVYALSDDLREAASGGKALARP
jgi:hypothetical protein